MARTVRSQYFLSMLAVILGVEQSCAEHPWQHGLFATFKDSQDRVHVCLQSQVSLNLKAGEAPHPRLNDQGSARWEGLLLVPRTANYEFSALLRGKVHVHVAGQQVLVAEADKPELVRGREVRLEAGPQTLSVSFTRAPGDARLQVFWQAAFLYREPLAFPALGHEASQAPPRLARDGLIDKGRLLAEEYSCARCHQPEAKLGQGLKFQPGPDLSDVGTRLFAGWLYRWLQSPRSLAPAASMPEFFSADEVGRTEAFAVAKYLESLGGPITPNALPADKEAVQRGDLLFARVGCAACHSNELPGGSYLSRSYPLINQADKTTPDRLAKYLLDPLAVNPGGRMPQMLLTEREAHDLAQFLCVGPSDVNKRRLPPPPSTTLQEAAFQRVEERPDELKEYRKLPAADRWLDLGKRVVIERGCNNCHTIAPGGQPFANVFAEKSLEALAAAKKGGCLNFDKDKRGRGPWYRLPADERLAVQAFLVEGLQGAGSVAPAHAARWTLVRFNCLACHVRDGAGGLPAAHLDELRKLAGTDNVEAVSPPPLTGVGNKLRTPWLHEVLTKDGRARPWLSVRMPHFGKENSEGLAKAFETMDGPAISDVTLPEGHATAGKALLGTTGFNCSACHDVAGTHGTVTRGPDLATMSRRVHYDWYRRWLQQPSRMQPGTRMPSVFPDGHSTLTTVLDGSANAQAAALWEYVSQIGR